MPHYNFKDYPNKSSFDQRMKTNNHSDSWRHGTHFRRYLHPAGQSASQRTIMEYYPQISWWQIVQTNSNVWNQHETLFCMVNNLTASKAVSRSTITNVILDINYSIRFLLTLTFHQSMITYLVLCWLTSYQRVGWLFSGLCPFLFKLQYIRWYS